MLVGPAVASNRLADMPVGGVQQPHVAGVCGGSAAGPTAVLVYRVIDGEHRVHQNGGREALPPII